MKDKEKDIVVRHIEFKQNFVKRNLIEFSEVTFFVGLTQP